MRRVVAYLVWKANWWELKAKLRVASPLEQSTLSGVEAYAWKQAFLMRQLAAKSVAYWTPPLTSMGISIDWAKILSESAPHVPSGENQADEALEVNADSGDESDEADDDQEVSLELDACVFEVDI
jgi:hypothetical protein